MGYKSKFKGAEIDAHLEKMVNVTYAELKKLRDEGKLIAGQMYRMTDYETTCTWANTQVAGHPFDLVLTALDNKTLDEKCSAIQSARDKDGYFANSNLPAWDVRYCLDNDTNRFNWAQMGGTVLQISARNAPFALDGVYTGETCEIGGVVYYKWFAYYSGNQLFPFLTTNLDLSVGDEIYLSNTGESIDETGHVVGLLERVDGKGVIYRLIDEAENDVPYDFKNIMFKRPLTEGKYDAENGVDTFCYTFCCIDRDTYVIEDQSVKETLGCYNNKFAVYCSDNVFLTFSGGYCSSNTFGDGCRSNTFGDECRSNTFGNDCYSNTFGDGCHSNTFGNSCSSTILGNYSYINTFGSNSYSNTLGNNCVSNTFGYLSVSNTLGNDCESNTFEDECSYNTLVDYCQYLIFKDRCKNITLLNDQTASKLNVVNYYRFSCIESQDIEVYRKRNYQTFITTDKNGNIVEYTVDDIINK